MLVAVAAAPESVTEASDAELAGRVRGGDRAALLIAAANQIKVTLDCQ